MPRLGYLFAAAILTPLPALAQPAPGVRVPPAIGAAYGRLGKAILSHDAAAARQVWAEDFVVNSPANTVLHREDVIAAMSADLLDYKDFHKHITYVGQQPNTVIVMGYDTMVPVKGSGAGRQVTRPFTDFWMKRADRWWLIARQATIAAVD